MTTNPSRNFFSVLAGVLLLTASAPGFAARLQSLEWEGGGASLQLRVDGKTDIHAERLEEGRRLRLRLPGTTLAPTVSPLPGAGVVKGVFPYVADNGKDVSIDVLLVEPQEMSVEKTPYGFRVRPQAQTAGKAGEGNVLQDITYTKLPGDRVHIKLKMAKPPEAPQTFTISSPPRISLDFAQTQVEMPRKSIKVAQGAVATVTALEGQGRTRVVLSLVRPVAHNVQLEKDGVSIIVENPAAVTGAEDAKPTVFSEARPGRHGLKHVDFRRGASGDGKVIIALSDPNVGINIYEQAGEILVDFLDASLPSELQRRLDVVDFATPIETIDTFKRGKDVRMVIRPKGQYEHLAYQAGEVFTIDVKPVVTKPGDEKKEDQFGYKGEKLSLNFQDIDVRAALQVIADFTGLNFVTSDSVKGSITLRLKDVPWDQALEIIAQTRNLAIRHKGNVVMVGPADEVAAKEKAALEAAKAVTELEPLVSELIRINYAKAEEVAALLKSIKAVDVTATAHPVFGGGSNTATVQRAESASNTLLSPRGQVTVDTRTNTLLVQDTTSKLREVRKLIAQIDQPVRQVMIETRLVEATDDFSRNLGVRWGVVRKDYTKDGKYGAVTCGTLKCSFDVQQGRQANLNDSLSVNLSADGIGGAVAGSIAASLWKLADGDLLNLELSALEAEGRGKIISSPRLITANQKKARIEQGQERVFTTTVLGVGSTVTKKAVLALDVTPQITPDDRVILDVLVTKDSFADASQGLINKKEIKTEVLLDNGETVVIGGIFEQAEANSTTQVPLLGDIPVLGWLFKKNNRFDNKVETLIFLTPRILTEQLTLK